MLFRLLSVISIVVAALTVSTASTQAQENPKTLPRPDDMPGAAGKPIKVFILMGQSNMVGMGDIVGWAMANLLKGEIK